MATSAVRANNEDTNKKSLVKWPLQYLSDRKEYLCGWCGQALVPNHTTFEAHFKSCKNSKENGLLTMLQKMNRKSQVQKKVDEMKTEVMEKFKPEIVMREMKIEEVTETIHSLLEAKGRSSADTDEPVPWEKETEAMWALLGMKEQSLQIELGSEPAETDAEAFLKRPKTNEEGVGDVKRQWEDETSKQLANKRIKIRSSQLDQFAIPMNCFNLVNINYLFQPSFRWTINGIEAIAELKTFELSSQTFYWIGYPVQAQVKFEVREDGCFYLSLRLTDDAKDQVRPIPQVFYMLKRKNGSRSQRTCHSQAYMFGSSFSHSLRWDLRFVHKSQLERSNGNVHDAVDIEVYVEPSAMTQRVHPRDGTLEWTIENYARRLRLERKQSVYFQESPYFYTGPNGYRVQVRMCLNGDEGRGPTARVLFFTGVYDAALPKSFPHSTTVTLINRKDPQRSIKKTIVKDIQNQLEYAMEMCTVKEVKHLLENDTLFCKVIIKSKY